MATQQSKNSQLQNGSRCWCRQQALTCIFANGENICSHQRLHWWQHKKHGIPRLGYPMFWNILRNLIQCNAVVLSVAFVKQLKIEKTETYKHINNSVLCYGKQLDLMSINFCNRSNRCAKSSFVKWKEAFQFFQSSI